MGLNQPEQTTVNTRKIMEYRSRMQIFLVMLKYFIPVGVVTAFFLGLALARFCVIWCSQFSGANLLMLFGLGALVISLVYIPIISYKKIASAIDKKTLISQTIGLTIVGYVIFFGIILSWLFIGGYKPEGWKPSLNEKILDFITTSESANTENN